MGSWLATCPGRDQGLLPACKFLGLRSSVCPVEHCTNIFSPPFARLQHHTFHRFFIKDLQKTHSVNLVLALENIIKKNSEWEGWSRCKK